MISLDGLRMHVSATASNGVVGAETVLQFVQRGDRVVARYAGGRVERGWLVGRVAGQELHFRYAQREGGEAIHGGASRCEVFALVMARQERATTFGALRRGRIAAWGFLGTAGVGLALTLAAPVVLPALVLVPAVLLAGTLGAGTAVGALGLARRADAQLRAGTSETRPPLPPAI
jgi:hypothetical protein